MAEEDDPAAAASRLEQALERIARFARPGAPEAPGTAAVAARLDALIANLRAALAGAPGP
ncbi:MAG: hypothetical protein J0I21_07835 [Alphaproteobacteria bacterium]|nr:hypothetical protein [Alphaproteobacteria bacterium]